MELVCIDPGPATSGLVIYDDLKKKILKIAPEFENESLLESLSHFREVTDYLVIEWFKNYGMAVGESVFLTAEFVGRCRQVYGINRSVKLDRLAVKDRLCHSHRAKDANIRQALIDRFPPTGGGRIPQIGTKKQPGPLFGISKHAWSALALAVAYSDGGYHA